jgi:outer membrane receptor protein involved in Fe transport
MLTQMLVDRQICSCLAATVMLIVLAPAAVLGADGELEEIIVTATRHEESLSKVPISVTAFSQDMMDERGIKDFLDIVRYTPGVSIDDSGTNAISIRGISSSGGAGTTGIYIDDTPIQMRAVGFNPDDTLPKTFDLERVEVLRGPQGTLFGSGSEGGTVRYILAQPKLSGSSTYLRSEVSFTENGQPSYEAGVAHGDTIVDGLLGYRASVWYRDDGGWINRIDPTTGGVIDHDINHAGALVLRLAGVWKPVSSFTVTPSLLYQNSRKHDESTYWPAYSDPSAGHFNTATPEQMPVPDEYYIAALKIQADMGRSQIFSNSSYYHRKELTAYQGTVYDLGIFQTLGWPSNPGFGGLPCGSASATPVPPCSWYPLIDSHGIHLPAGFANFQTPNVIANRQDSWVQEIRWQSEDDSSHWRWTVGAFGQLSKEGSIEELKSTDINPFFEALYGVPATSLFGNFYSCPTAAAYPGIPACDIYYNANTTFDRQFAAFGELTYAFTDQWKLTLGERVARTSFSLNHYADGLENFGPSSASATQSETPNTPKASVAFQMDTANLFYATYAKGFRVGGGNAPLPVYCDQALASDGYSKGAPLTYKSDSTQSYEVGSKNTFGQTLRVATSVYYIKWNDIQQSVYVSGNCGLQFTDNLGTAVAKGFDAQAELALGPISVDAAVGYTSARYTANSPHAGLAQTGDAISGEAAIDGSPGTNPPWTAAVGVQYNFSALAHNAFVRADYEFTSRNPWLATVQNPVSSQYDPNTYSLSSTSFVQMRAGATLGSWTAALFCDNLLNSHTVTNYQLGVVDTYNPAVNAATEPSSIQQNQYTFRPRTIGLTATYRTK